MPMWKTTRRTSRIRRGCTPRASRDRKSTRLNSSHQIISYAFFCLKKKNKKTDRDLAAKGRGAKEWNNSLKTKLSLLHKNAFIIKMIRHFWFILLQTTILPP